MMGILKRKFSELDDGPCYSSSSSPASSVSSPASSGWDSDRDNLDFTPHSPPPLNSLPLKSILKRPKLADVQGSVGFDLVTVYSFPRCQGFTSVPSRGGATLGMMRRHNDVQTFTIAEHAVEQRHRRREQLRERRRQEKFLEIKQKLISTGAINEKDAEILTIDQVPIEETYININSTEMEGGFLQPFTSKQRQAILLAAGVKRVDKEEKRQLHALRLSRETCGCDCQGFCEPESCACSIAGIKCQVDRFNFPCGCGPDGCGNTQGRVEFDSRRVRTHHIHTLMRLELEWQINHEHEPFSKDQSKDQDNSSNMSASQQDNNHSIVFSFEEKSDNPLTIPSSFNLITEQPVVEENSCSSDMSVSSSEAVSIPGSPTISEDSRPLSHNLNILDNNNLPVQNTTESLTQNPTSDFTGHPCSKENILMDILSASVHSNCLNKDHLDDNSLEDFPNTPSPSVDYYMDLSLSSDSDLEFFDSDYTSGLPHSSFKSQRPSDNMDHLQLFSTDSLPQYESSTYLLESLIGLTDD